MRPSHKILLLVAIIAACMSAWTIWDTLQGKQGFEELFLVIPMLLGSIVLAIALLFRCQPGPAAAALPPTDPAALAQRNWRFAKLGLAIVTVLMALTTVTWAVRSGTIWMPVLVGGIALAVTWTVMVIMLRPKAQR